MCSVFGVFLLGISIYNFHCFKEYFPLWEPPIVTGPPRCPGPQGSLGARARVGAQSGLGPGPGWGPYGPIGPLWAHKGPYGPIRALMGQIWLKKLIISMKNHKSINKNIKIVNLEILKVKTWFGDKDL